MKLLISSALQKTLRATGQDAGQHNIGSSKAGSEDLRGFAARLMDGLLIRRSLVRAQVEEPIKSMGYVARRSPFVFAVLERYWRKSNIQCLSAMVLIGCGGGGSDAPEPVACSPQTVAIQLYGDSTMRGPESVASPYRVQKVVQLAMDLRFGPGAVEVTSEAIGGTKAGDLIYGTRGFYAWPAGVTGHIVVDNHGVNDAAASHRTPIETYKAQLRIIASRPGVTLQTPVPMNTDITDPAVGTAENDSYAQAMREVAAEKGVPVIEVHRYVLGLPGWKSMLSDGIHPTPELYEMIARNVQAPALATQVALLRCEH